MSDLENKEHYLDAKVSLLGAKASLLDATGLFCPEPVMLLHKKMRELKAGELLKVVATDPSTARDIPKFCHFLDHELVSSSDDGKLFHYCIRKSDS